MNGKEAIEAQAAVWGQAHAHEIPRQLTRWLGENVPLEAQVPAVYNMIFHVAQTSNMTWRLFDERTEDRPKDWNQFVQWIAETYIAPKGHKDGCYLAGIIADFSFLRTESKDRSVQWKAPEGLEFEWFEELVQEGLLQKSGNTFKLDDAIHRVFGPAIDKAYKDKLRLEVPGFSQASFAEYMNMRLLTLWKESEGYYDIGPLPSDTELPTFG